jgi:hypothetical protein
MNLRRNPALGQYGDAIFSSLGGSEDSDPMAAPPACIVAAHHGEPIQRAAVFRPGGIMSGRRPMSSFRDDRAVAACILAHIERRSCATGDRVMIDPGVSVESRG